MDFFISYNYQDRDYAEWIAYVLEDAGYQTIIQAWDFQPGQNFIVLVNEALKKAQRVIAVLSPDYIHANLSKSEWAAAFAMDPEGNDGKLVSVRIEECTLDGLLNQIIHIDLVGKSEEEAEKSLLDGLRRERKKPEARPAFPMKSGKHMKIYKNENLEGYKPSLVAHMDLAYYGLYISNLMDLWFAEDFIYTETNPMEFDHLMNLLKTCCNLTLSGELKSEVILKLNELYSYVFPYITNKEERPKGWSPVSNMVEFIQNRISSFEYLLQDEMKIAFRLGKFLGRWHHIEYSSENKIDKSLEMLIRDHLSLLFNNKIPREVEKLIKEYRTTDSISLIHIPGRVHDVLKRKLTFYEISFEK